MEFKDKQAIYLQIADFVCEEILLRKWPPGERIPSVRDLAAMLEVNPNTVVRTYEFLQNKQIIFNKRGIGYSADDQAIEKIMTFRKERFLETELPEVFKAMYLLHIDMEEVQARYNEFVRTLQPLIN
jgi:GntR family transcriptional regulator